MARIYRASSLGYSLEALVAPYLGYLPQDTPEWLQEKFDEGHRLEEIVEMTLADDGWQIQDQELEVNLEVMSGVVVQGHVDGIIGGERVLEIKSMRPSVYASFEKHGIDSPDPLMEKYRWQISAYMLALKMPAIMVGYNKATEEMYSVEIDEPPYLISDIANRLGQVEKHIVAGTIPEDCKDYPCAYSYLHPVKDEVEEVDDELDAIMAAWLSVDREIKALEAEKKSLREEIIERTNFADAAAKVKGTKSGVVVSRYWQKASEYVVKKEAKWVTKVEGPRNAK